MAGEEVVKALPEKSDSIIVDDDNVNVRHGAILRPPSPLHQSLFARLGGQSPHISHQKYNGPLW
jgi:hypothetical protein